MPQPNDTVCQIKSKLLQLMWGLRAMMPKRSLWRIAQFDTLRLRLIKIAARVVELKTQIRLHLPSACPDHTILRVVLGRMPRLVT